MAESTAVGLRKTGEDGEQRRLATAAWPGDADGLARTDVERDIVEDDPVAPVEAFADALRRDRQP